MASYLIPDHRRDRYSLTREELLSDYGAISGKRRGAAKATGLRVGSHQYLDVLAAECTRGKMDWSKLYDYITRVIAQDGFENLSRVLFGSNAEQSVKAAPLAEIGEFLIRIVDPKFDRRIGVECLIAGTLAMPMSNVSRRLRTLTIQVLIMSGRLHKAQELLGLWKNVARADNLYLKYEPLNPFRMAGIGYRDINSASYKEWLHGFNLPFRDSGVAPVELRAGDGSPLSRLSVRVPKLKTSHQANPLVSVIIAWSGEPLDLLELTLDSLSKQSVESIEIVIAVEHDSGVNARASALGLENDGRVIIFYADAGESALNGGVQKARGKFVSFCGVGVWAHPQKLEKQIQFLDESPGATGCFATTIRCSDDLLRLGLNSTPFVRDTSSLFLRRNVFQRTGGFLPSGSAAFDEFVERVNILLGDGVKQLDLALSITRSELRIGMRLDDLTLEKATAQFRSSYKHWHQTADVEELSGHKGAEPNVSIPNALQAVEGPRRFDVILAGDWRKYGGPQKSMLEEIRALRASGKSVAVLNLEAARFMARNPDNLNPQVQKLINDGVVDEVLYDDPHSSDLLILRYPPILQMAPDRPSGLKVKKVVITANQAPSELDGSDIRYRVADSFENAKRIFTKNVTWVPQGPQVREAIAGYLGEEELEDFDFPGILETSLWESEIPHRRRSSKPVIGRHSRDNEMKWPEIPQVLREVYPVDGRFDVRIMGGASSPLRVLGEDRPPAGWVVYPKDHFAVPEFLHSLDFFVFYQHSNAVEAFGRAILEGIASNIVVVLPPHYEEVFGDAAVYADPCDVEDLVWRYYRDPQLYESQQRRAVRVLKERFSHSGFSQRVEGLLARGSVSSGIS